MLPHLVGDSSGEVEGQSLAVSLRDRQAERRIAGQRILDRLGLLRPLPGLLPGRNRGHERMGGGYEQQHGDTAAG